MVYEEGNETFSKLFFNELNFLNVLCSRDLKDWIISIVPSISTLENATKVLNKVQKDIEKQKQDKLWLRKYSLPFEIVQVDENFVGAKIY